jgi:hypothetical protein
MPLNNKKLQKKLWKNIEIGKETIPVYTVNGNYIRNEIYIEFLCGGHNLATSHKFVPKKEIWLEKTLKGIDKEAILVHEAHEYNLMKNKGYSYIHAHKLANQKEARFRKSNL